MKVAGLFSGIGGFERAFEAEGYSSVLLCENHPAATAVLRERFPGVRMKQDIRALDKLPSGTEVVCAGFPCQNLSSSGAKEGISGQQSSLVDEVFRLLQKKRVPWVVFENVKFMLHLQKGLAMRHIVTSLEALGYKWAYRVLNSHGFGVPQRRERVFILASLEGNPWDVLFSDQAPKLKDEIPSVLDPVGFYWTEGRFATGLAANAIPPLKGGSTIGIPSPPAILFPEGIAGTPDIRDAERMQGFPVDWTLPASEAGRLSERWKLIGNAVTVNVVRWLARQIKNPKRYQIQDTMPINGSWPEAGWGAPGLGRFHAQVGSMPARKKIVGLDTFLRFEPKQLSKRAASGFLSRARAGNLNYPPDFLENLEAFIEKAQ